MTAADYDALRDASRWLSLDSFPRAIVDAGLVAFRRRRPWQGAFVEVPGELPAAFIQLPSGVTPDRQKPFTIMRWVWPSLFGNVLTVSGFAEVGPLGRAFELTSNPAAFSALSKDVLVVFLRGEKPVFAAMQGTVTGIVAFHLRESLKVAQREIPLRADANAALNYIGNDAALLAHFRPTLSPIDRLAFGWVDRYAHSVQVLDRTLKDVRSAQIEAAPPSDAGAALVWASLEHAHSVEAFVTQLETAVAAVPRMYDFLLALGDAAEHAHSGTSDVHADTFKAALLSGLEVMLLHSDRTLCGGAVPWIEKGGDLEHHAVDPTAFPVHADPSKYWERLPSLPIYHFGAFIEAGSFPADFKLAGGHSPAWEAMPLAEDEAASNAAGDALMDEALSHKKWTIPSGATIELPFGPFTHCQAWEVDSPLEAFFIFHTAQGEFALAGLEPDNHYLYFPALEALPLTTYPEFPELDRWAAARPKIAAGLKLVLAAVMRDFFVVEQRESVFGVREVGKKGPLLSGTIGAPRVVYLPRVRYTPRPDLERCAHQLGHEQRRAHHVAAHLRRVARASESQLLLATRYGVRVPEGHTFVRPHERGGLAQDVIYRSRSALRSLYTETPGGRIEVDAWFRFEKDVQAVMGRLGFRVEHVAASRRGDHGIDLFATKGTDLDLVNWIIQCKCYGPTHPVKPAIVRELIGALTPHPRGTRGMIVTTSYFTGDATDVAASANIRLMDGREFAELLRAGSE